MKICTKCNKEFSIFPEEQALRTTISATLETGPVPEPSLCPDCRTQRRMARRNERYLYQRTCDLTGKNVISIYPASVPFPVYDRTVWWGDQWDAEKFGREFDFSRPFFEQFQELQNIVPRAAINSKNVVNSEYSNHCFDCKNSYLSPCSYTSEDLLYCYWVMNCKQCIDCSYCFQCELCAHCTDCNNSYNCRSSVLAHNCIDSAFLYDCRACNNCFGCVGLRHKEYCFFNEQLSKDDYFQKLHSIDLENPEQLEQVINKVKELGMKHPHKMSVQEKTEHCSGDYIFESKNCLACYQTYKSEDCMYVSDVTETKNCLDGYHYGWSQACYEIYSITNQQGSAFVSQCWDGSENFYSDSCIATTHCFGCIGLKHKNYCILNKQYSKETYEDMIKKIVAHMKQTHEWGEFFPSAFSVFPYNETTAQEYYPLSKEQAEAQGFLWRDPDPKEYQPQTYTLPTKIADTTDDILKAILACETCKKNYRLISQELAIYRSKCLSIPHQCPDCRHKDRLSLRNKRQLFDRTCMKCGTNIITTYAPDRPEIVYCEACYEKEIY